MLLNRNIEAEYILFRAIDIDENDDEILYWLFDILCRRKQLGLLSSIGNKLDKTKNELLYIKSLIKYLIITNKINELEDLFIEYFEKYKTDKEFVCFILSTAIRENNYRLTYMVSKTIFKNELFHDLTEPQERRLKNHFYLLIVKLLRENNDDNKNS